MLSTKPTRRFPVVCMFLSLSVLINTFGITQTSKRINRSLQMDVFDSKQFPELAAPVGSTLRIKVATRKSVYQMGDLISIDYAILNVSKSSVYTLSSRYVTLEFRNADTREVVKVYEYGMGDYFISSRRFESVFPREFASWSQFIILGFDSRPYDRTKTVDGVTRFDQMRAFEEGNFLNFGDGQLRIEAPGRYEVTAHLTNDLVVKSPKKRPFKTAVGTIASEPIAFEVLPE